MLKTRECYLARHCYATTQIGCGASTALDSACHEGTVFHRLSDWRGLTHTLQRIGAKHFSLMSHGFYSIIDFGRAAQIQERNDNVV